MAFRKRLKGGRKSKYWYYDFIHEGRRYWGCTWEILKARADMVEARKRQDLAFGTTSVEDVTFKELAEKYTELHVEHKKAKDFFENLLMVLQRHFDPKLLSEIGVREAEEFLSMLRTREKRKAGPATCNRYQSVARHMWNKAAEWGYVSEGVNPWRKIARGKERGRERFLSDTEAGALLKVMPAWLRVVVVAALHSGARRGELLGLTWEDVDFELGLVRFRDTKNGEDRAVPMSDTLRELLSTMPSRFVGGRVFCGADGKPIELEALRTGFRRAVANAALPGLRIHDLRHSAASFMVQAGVPLFEVQHVLGHRDIRMTQRYAHLAPEHLKGAVAVLDRLQLDVKTAGSRG